MNFSSFKTVNKEGRGIKLIDEEVMQSLIDEGLRTKEIAERLGLTPRQITVYKNHRNMKQTRTAKLILTDIEEQVIIGSILGDGCIEVNNKEREYYRLTIKHGEKQREYSWYKYNLLKRLCKEPIEKFRIDKREKFKDHIEITLRTTTNEVFKEYRDRWYINGKKEVNKEDLFKLSPLGLAIWIMDDGYCDKDTITLSTDSFNDVSLNLIVEFFAQFNITTTIQRTGRIRISRKDVKYIIEEIKPFIIESMEYKVRVKPFELLENLEIDNQQRSPIGNIGNVQRLTEVTLTHNGDGKTDTSGGQEVNNFLMI